MPLPSGVQLRRARADELPLLLCFLNQQRALRRWAPVLSPEDFLPGGRCDTLRAEDFFIALRGEAPRGCIATWDQSALRQGAAQTPHRVVSNASLNHLARPVR